jgi:hypothetical protein
MPTLLTFLAWRRKLIEWRDRERYLPSVVVLRDGRKHLQLLDSVPATRGDCPTGPCPHVRCRFHMWRQDEQPGRPGLSAAPRDEHGRVVSRSGELGARKPPTLVPRWLEVPTPESCALRVAEAGPHSLDEIAEIEDKHRTLIGGVLRRALRKLKAAGVTTEDLKRIAPRIG